MYGSDDLGLGSRLAKVRHGVKGVGISFLFLCTCGRPIPLGFWGPRVTLVTTRTFYSSSSVLILL